MDAAIAQHRLNSEVDEVPISTANTEPVSQSATGPDSLHPDVRQEAVGFLSEQSAEDLDVFEEERAAPAWLKLRELESSLAVGDTWSAPPLPTKPIEHFAISDDGQRVLLVGYDAYFVIRTADLQIERAIYTEVLDRHGSFSPNGAFLAVMDTYQNSLEVHDLSYPYDDPRAMIKRNIDGIDFDADRTYVAIDPTGKMVAFACEKYQIELPSKPPEELPIAWLEESARELLTRIPAEREVLFDEQIAQMDRNTLEWFRLWKADKEEAQAKRDRGEPEALEPYVLLAPEDGSWNFPFHGWKVEAGESVEAGQLLANSAHAEIKAPCDGRLLRILIQEHTWPEPGQRLAKFELDPLDAVRRGLNVAEKDRMEPVLVIPPQNARHGFHKWLVDTGDFVRRDQALNKPRHGDEPIRSPCDGVIIQRYAHRIQMKDDAHLFLIQPLDSLPPEILPLETKTDKKTKDDVSSSLIRLHKKIRYIIAAVAFSLFIFLRIVPEFFPDGIAIFLYISSVLLIYWSLIFKK